MRTIAIRSVRISCYGQRFEPPTNPLEEIQTKHADDNKRGHWVQTDVEFGLFLSFEYILTIIG